MIKLFFLMIFFLMSAYSLKADQVPGVNDQGFTAELDNIKNPFEDGFPKPSPVPKPIFIRHKPTHYKLPKLIILPKRKSQPVTGLEVKLPDLKLQGVIVGEDIHQAIINDQVVPLLGTIEGARVDSVTKQGVELFFKGKKFFLKVD